MPAGRVSIAALCLAVGAVLELVSTAYADAPAADAPPVAVTDGPSQHDAPTEASPGQEMPVGVAGDAYADTDPSALTDFRPTLDAYGTWMDDPSYGTVWAPSPDEIGQDFTPYLTAGHWAYDGDYIWVSDYTWGWVAFHYGRWQWIPKMGWAWIPGRAYAGAWVAWRLGSDEYAYVGWAPLPPAWVWRDGIAAGAAFAPWQPFVFCAQGELFAPAIATRIRAGKPAAIIAPHTRPYVPANPVVTGISLAPARARSKPPEHPFAQPVPHGPPPASLGIDPLRVVRLTGNERGLASAQVYARPSTAQAVGAHPPIPHVVHPTPIVVPYSTAPPTAHAPRRR